MKGFKAFNEDMTCQGFQYEEGKTYEFPRAKVCQEGAHFCVDPWDCLKYYDLIGSEFHEVESLPDAETDKNNDDSKISTTKIKIGAKLGIKGFVDAAVNFLLKTRKGSKDGGDSSRLASSGHSSQLALNGQDSVGAQIGVGGEIKGKTGNWITLAEWEYNKTKNRYIPTCVKSAQIDGIKLKEDVWYVLENKEFTESK